MFTTVDLVLLAGLGFFAWRSFQKGLIREVVSLVAILLSLYIAFHFSDLLTPYLKNWIQSETLRSIVSFALIFIVVHFLVHRLGKALEELLKQLYLGWMNRVLGTAIGLVKGFVIIGLLLFLLVRFPHPLVQKEIQDSEISSSLLFYWQSSLALLEDEFPNWEKVWKETLKEPSKKSSEEVSKERNQEGSSNKKDPSFLG